jgi:hypothetical protein
VNNSAKVLAIEVKLPGVYDASDDVGNSTTGREPPTATLRLPRLPPEGLRGPSKAIGPRLRAIYAPVVTKRNRRMRLETVVSAVGLEPTTP